MSSAQQPSGNERDAHIVDEICGHITADPPRSFFLFAGAGSGKTRTLVEVVRRITSLEGPHANRLHSRSQSVRVITYTKNAAAVVAGRLGENELTTVSTIHAFCWDLIAGFDGDIRSALLAINAERLEKARAHAASKVRGENATDRAKYAELEAEAEEIRQTTAFIYHPDRNTYGPGALSHSDVLAVASWLLHNRPTLQHILRDRHPLVLIDESQDTSKKVLDALFDAARTHPTRFTLGLIGDHRQRIYPDGHADLPARIPPEWPRPALQMNHRSRGRIVTLINEIWNADIEGRTQSKTGVDQHARKEKSGGIVRLFIGDARIDTQEKVRLEADCARVMAEHSGDPDWQRPGSIQVLALEHTLVAKRGDFSAVFAAMKLLDDDASMPKANGDRSGPPMVRPLLGPVLELAACRGQDGLLNEFAATQVLRRHGTFDKIPQGTTERQAALKQLHAKVVAFAAAASKPDATVREVLRPLLEGAVFDADRRLIEAFHRPAPTDSGTGAKRGEDRDDRRARAWPALFNAPWFQVLRYRAYLDGEAELATHHVVKGSEFQRVMVVMDDEDAGGTMFSYDKLFGAESLSDTDRENIESGKETVVDRTLRLLYVTCSRAEEGLALVLWSRNPDVAVASARKSGWFDASEVSSLASSVARLNTNT